MGGGLYMAVPVAATVWRPQVEQRWIYRIDDDEAFVIELLQAKKILVTHGTGFNWPDTDHFRLVTLPDEDVLTEAIGRIAEFLETKRA